MFAHLARVSRRRALHVAAALAITTLAAACGKDSTEPDEAEPSVASIRLAFSNAAAPVTFSGVAGETRNVTIPRGATTVTASWLRADGTIDPVATTQTFRLEVTPAATGGITFVRSATNAFSGSITATTATAAGTTIPVQFALFHVAEGHEDFGPITVNIAVTP